MVHIAYTMGLRPQEISRLTLDDIAFGKAEMNVRYRKAGLPVTMPIPQKTLKAIAAYLVGGRPENDCRELFLQCCRPYRPVSSRDCLLCHKELYAERPVYLKRPPPIGCDIAMHSICWKPGSPSLRSRKCLVMTTLKQPTDISIFISNS